MMQGLFVVLDTAADGLRLATSLGMQLRLRLRLLTHEGAHDVEPPAAETKETWRPAGGELAGPFAAAPALIATAATLDIRASACRWMLRPPQRLVSFAGVLLSAVKWVIAAPHRSTR
jgi:hypothetical protein